MEYLSHPEREPPWYTPVLLGPSRSGIDLAQWCAPCRNAPSKTNGAVRKNSEWKQHGRCAEMCLLVLVDDGIFGWMLHSAPSPFLIFCISTFLYSTPYKPLQATASTELRGIEKANAAKSFDAHVHTDLQKTMVLVSSQDDSEGSDHPNVASRQKKRSACMHTTCRMATALRTY
jgi:hypothetical protein